MRLFPCFVAAHFFCAAGPGQTTEFGDRVTYILHEEGKRRWCGYSNKQQWTSDLQHTGVDITGYLEYSDARLTQINVREAAVTGDWVVDDKYTVSANGELTELRRLITYFSENEQRKQRYDLRGGKAKLVEASIADLQTGSPLKLPRLNSKFDTWPLFIRFADLPFKALVLPADKVRSSGVHCITRDPQQ